MEILGKSKVFLQEHVVDQTWKHGSFMSWMFDVLPDPAAADLLQKRMPEAS